MTKITYYTGDIFQADAVAQGQGVNTHGVMGSGIALPMKKFWGEPMYQEYRWMCQRGLLVPGGVHRWDDEGWEGTGPRFLYNIASQDKPGPHGRLEWLDRGVRAALADMDTMGLDRMSLPRIGAGVAGLHWEDVQETLEALVVDYDANIDLWSLPNADDTSKV